MPTLTVFTASPWEHALSLLRFRAPAESLGWRVIVGKEEGGAIYPERVAQADVVLIQRDFPRFYPEYRQVMAQARRLGKTVIYDLDDLLLALPEEHPACNAHRDALGGMLAALLEADRVVLSSPVLRDVLYPLRPDAVVWPTVLPDDIWQPHVRMEPPEGRRVILGYAGGSTHSPDVEMISPVLARLLDAYPQVELRFWGVAPPEKVAGHLRVHHVRQEVGSYRDFADSLLGAKVHIWMAPLQDGVFNRCKSLIKFWEYSALGGAAVYSRVEPYTRIVQDGENALLAAGLKEWETALRQLIEDASLRKRLAHEARATLDARGWLSLHMADWERIYTNPAAGVQLSPVNEVLARFAEQVQTRSIERHIEALHHIEQIAEYRMRLLEREQQLAECERQLVERSRQVADIFGSRSWRVLQRLNKWRHWDFSPLEPPPSLDDLMRGNRP